MQLEVNVSLNEIEPHSNDLVLLEIPSHDLFAVHDVCGVVETYSSVGMVAVLTDQVGAVTDPVTVHEVFLLDYSLVA